MTVLADESVDGPIVEQLRLDGLTVLYVAEMEAGITDAVVLERANQRMALLITADKDFGELIFRERKLSSDGVVLIRLQGLSPEMKASVVSNAVREHGNSLHQAFSVIMPGGVRIRARQ